jgi:hypothetical protein
MDRHNSFVRTFTESFNEGIGSGVDLQTVYGLDGSTE